MMLSFLTGGDVYDPDRVAADREQLRQYYRSKGYADASVTVGDRRIRSGDKGFTLTFSIDEGPLYHFGDINLVCNVPGLDPEKLRRLLLIKHRRGVRRQRARQDHRDRRHRDGQARLSLCAGHRPHHARCRRAADRRRAVDRSGTAHLCRAHRDPRQYPHPRLCDPARIRHCRGRRLQQDADRPRRTAAQEPELFQDRQDFDASRARRRIVSCSMSRSPNSRPAISTFPAAIRRPMACSPRSRLARTTFWAPARRSRPPSPMANMRKAPTCRLRIRIFSATTSRPASTCSPSRPMRAPTSPMAATSMARPCQLGTPINEQVGMQWRYSISRQDVTLDPARWPATPSLPIQQAALAGPQWVSAVGDTVTYNTLDNTKTPTSGISAQLRQDLAGLGGDVNFLRTTEDVRYYQSHQQRPGRHGPRPRRLHHRLGRPAGAADRQLFRRPDDGARICARTDLGRAISPPAPPWIMSAAACTGRRRPNCRARSPACRRNTDSRPRPLSMPAACFDYGGPTTFPGSAQSMQLANANVLRSSVGVGLTWASPFGALTVSYAVP